MTAYDVLVLGADVEGLTAAAVLAGAGLRVGLVDARERTGGVDARVEFHPGFEVPGLRHECGLLRRKHLRSLNLEELGLSWRTETPNTRVFGPEGRTVRLGAELESDTPGEAERFAAWRQWLARLSGLVNEILDEAPPDALEPRAGDVVRLAKKGLRLRGLGNRDLYELLRVAPSTAADWIGDSFRDPLVQAGLVGPALLGTMLGPRAGGTSALVLLGQTARQGEPRGGLAALVDALEDRARRSGTRFHLGSAPARLLFEKQGQVRGVELVTGETLEAPRIVSALDVGTTLLELVPPPALPTNLEVLARGWRRRGATAALWLAYESAPAFAKAGGERFVIARDLVQLERTADALKYGELPDDPWLDVRVWSAGDPSCAPPGGASVSILVHGVSHTLREGWNDAASDALQTRVFDALEAACPGARSGLVATRLLRPVDIEERYALPGGHLEQGELALDQLWIQRPSYTVAHYATPLPGLYLGGASSHPGGPFAAGAGALAAGRLLAQKRARERAERRAPKV